MSHNSLAVLTGCFGTRRVIYAEYCYPSYSGGENTESKVDLAKTHGMHTSSNHTKLVKQPHLTETVFAMFALVS